MNKRKPRITIINYLNLIHGEQVWSLLGISKTVLFTGLAQKQIKLRVFAHSKKGILPVAHDVLIRASEDLVSKPDEIRARRIKVTVRDCQIRLAGKDKSTIDHFDINPINFHFEKNAVSKLATQSNNLLNIALKKMIVLQKK